MFEVQCDENYLIFDEFVYHVTPVKLFSSSNVFPCSVFDNIPDAKLISTLRSGKSTLYLLIIQSFLNFPVIPESCN